MKRLALLLLALAALAGLVGFLAQTGASPDATTRVSVDSAGDQGNDSSHEADISADGRFVIFTSWATNLVAGDTNGSGDIFARDRQTGATERVSVDSSGNQAGGWSQRPRISADGRYVVFQSGASNLVAGDTNGWPDIFVHDRATGATDLVSVDSSGNQANGNSTEPAIGADGRFVVFESKASNLVSGDTNAFWDVFVHDRQTGATERVSVDSAGNEHNPDDDTGYPLEPAISADGRFVAFQSWASNLVTADTNNSWDVFVHDRQTGATERVSVDSSGNQANSHSNGPAISADGRFVTFTSSATNLVTGDTNNRGDVFVHDRQTGATYRVSVSSSGQQSNNGSLYLDISADGRFVTFASNATTLVAGDTNNNYDIFVHDRQTGATERVSVDSSGNQGNDQSTEPRISADGRYVVFHSPATNLVLGDTNGKADVFVHDRQGASPTPTPTSTPTPCPTCPTPTPGPFQPTYTETIDDVAPADLFVLPSDDDCPVGTRCKTLLQVFIPDGQPAYSNWGMPVYIPSTHFSFAYDAIVPDGAIVARNFGYVRVGPIGDCSSGYISSYDQTLFDATTNSATTTGSRNDLGSFVHWPSQLDTLRDEVLSENPGAVLQARWVAPEGVLNILFFRLSDGSHVIIGGNGDPADESLWEKCGPHSAHLLTLGETLDNPDTPQDEGGIPLSACTAAGTETFWVSIDRNDTPPGDFVTLFDTSTCSANTPVGTDVTVPLLGGIGSTAGLEVTFSEVTQSGSTSVTGSTAGDAPPTAFVVRGLSGQSFYYDVNTTSAFSPPLTVCINYDDTGLTASQEENLALMQNHDGEFVDCTTSLDTAGNVICGTAPGLSTWAVMLPGAPVGGIAQLPDASDSSGLNHIALAGLAAALVALSAGAWYARRRWLG
jgi:hypothetical protein